VQICSRLEEIRSQATITTAAQTWFTRNWVIERFKINCEASMKEGKRQAANTALRILGMEVGLFQHV